MRDGGLVPAGQGPSAVFPPTTPLYPPYSVPVGFNLNRRLPRILARRDAANVTVVTVRWFPFWTVEGAYRVRVATVRAVERQIWRIEGFNVRVLHPDGTDVRGDRTGMPGYPFARAMKNAANVRTWIERRFLPTYPGFDVVAVDASGHRVHGNTRLATVRDTYLDA